MDNDEKITYKILTKTQQQYNQKIIHYHPTGFITGIQGWFFLEQGKGIFNPTNDYVKTKDTHMRM